MDRSQLMNVPRLCHELDDEQLQTLYTQVSRAYQQRFSLLPASDVLSHEELDFIAELLKH